MPRQTNSEVRFECDTCGTDRQVQSWEGPPEGWLGIYPAPEDGDTFCSWYCLAVMAARKDQVEKAQAEADRLVAEAAEAEPDVAAYAAASEGADA